MADMHCTSENSDRRKRNRRKGGCGVYEIVHVPSGMRYIGSSAEIKTRIYNHFNQLSRGAHLNRRMQELYDVCGPSGFTHSILMYCDESELLGNEQRFMDIFSPELNLTMFADSVRGMTHSDEAKRKISISKIGKPKPIDVRKKISASLSGRKRDPEAVRRTASALKGRPRDKDAVAKTAAALAGVPKTEAHREKLRAALKMFNDAQIRDIRAMRKAGFLYREIGERFNVSPQTVGKIITGQRYAWVT